MNKYVNLILEKLLSKYERSKISKEGSTKKINIFFNFNSKNINDYVCEDSYKYEPLIESAITFLEKEALIYTEREKNGLIKKVLLNLDNIEKAYQLIKKHPKNEIENQYRKILIEYPKKTLLVNSFCKMMIDKIDSYKSHKSYFNSVEELTEILTILNHLEKQKVEISQRNFSAKYLHDSKRLEKIEIKISKIIKQLEPNNISDIINDSSNILSNFNVFKNPTFVFIRGKGKFKINNQVIDLQQMNGELILTSNHLINLVVLELNVKRVVTVENLTTFYDFPINDNLVVYLGGFHNHIRREFLVRLKEIKTTLKFYHCGDIDVGGFYILNHLIKKTGIKFIPIKMNIETLKKYKNYTKKLTIEDKRRLNYLIRNKNMEEFIPIFKYMLENNIKLEQENIDYYDYPKSIINQNSEANLLIDNKDGCVKKSV